MCCADIKASDDKSGNTTSEDTKTDTDTDSDMKPMKIGAFSVAQRGGARRGRRSSEEVEDGYNTTSAVSPRAGRSPVPIVDPKRPPRASPLAADQPVKHRPRVTRVSTLEVDIPEPKSPASKKKPLPADRVAEKPVPSSDTKARPRRAKPSESSAVGYSTDYAGPSRPSKKNRSSPKIAAEPASPAPKVSPFSDVEDSPSAKVRRTKRKAEASTDADFHAPVSEPTIVPIKNASPTKPRTPVRTPVDSPVGSRNGSPSRKTAGGDGVLMPLVVERQKATDRSKRLSMQHGYATDAPPARPRGSSGEKKKSSRKPSADVDAVGEITGSSSSSSIAGVSAPNILVDPKKSHGGESSSPRKGKKRTYAKGSPRAPHPSPQLDDLLDSPKTDFESADETGPDIDLIAAASAAISTPSSPALPRVKAPEQPSIATSVPNASILEQQVEPQSAAVEVPVAAEAPVTAAPPSTLVIEVEKSAAETLPPSATEAPATPDHPSDLVVTAPQQVAGVTGTAADAGKEATQPPTPAVAPVDSPLVKPSPSSEKLSIVEVLPTVETEVLLADPVAVVSGQAPAAATALEPSPATASPAVAPLVIPVRTADNTPRSSSITNSPHSVPESPVTPSSELFSIRTGSASPTGLSPSPSASGLASSGSSPNLSTSGRSKIDRTSSIVESAASRGTLQRQTSIKDVLSSDDPVAKSQMMKNFFTGLGMTKKK